MSHFLDLANLQGDALRQMLDAGAARKAARAGLPKGAVDADAPLAGHVLAMIFEKPVLQMGKSLISNKNILYEV